MQNWRRFWIRYWRNNIGGISCIFSRKNHYKGKYQTILKYRQKESIQYATLTARFLVFTLHEFNMKHSPLMLLLCLSTTMWAQQTKRTTISGKIVNSTSNEVKLVHFNSWDWENVPPVNLDPNGCFRFVLQLEKGRQLQIENSDNGWDFFFSAGDSVFLTLHPDQDDASIEASGKGANHCLWFAENAKWSAMLKPISKELLPAAAALKVDSAFRARRVHFENYCLQHQEVSEDFKLYYRLEYRYKPYRNKQRLPFTYAMNHKIDEADVPIPADMFAYFDTATINVDKYFISVNYQYFVIDVVRHTYENLLKRSNEQKTFLK